MCIQPFLDELFTWFEVPFATNTNMTIGFDKKIMKAAVVSLGHKENYLISVKRAITNMPLSLVTIFRLNMNS